MRPAAMLLLSGILCAQPKFEVASIKRASLPIQHVGVHIGSGRVDIGAADLKRLIAIAYKVEASRVFGPDWMATQRLDILAKIPEGATKDQVPEMLQALLAERFKLESHREYKQEPVYALLIGKDGPKLKEASTDDLTSAGPFPNGRGDRLLLAISDHDSDGWWTYSRLNGSTVFEAPRITIPQFVAFVITQHVDLPVIDKTGLTGAYDVSLIAPLPRGLRHASGPGDPTIGRGGEPDAQPTQASLPTGPDIFKAVEKLGLRLERGKAPIEHLIVDHLERTPTEN